MQLSATEFAENDTSKLATLSAKDQDKGDKLTYSVVEDKSGLFDVSGKSLILKAGAKLDFETQPRHEITLKATDKAGLSVTKTFTIDLTDVNEAPTSIALSNASVSEGAQVGDVVGYLSGVDPEGDDLSFTVSSKTFAVKTVTVGGEAKVALVVAEGAKLDFDAKPQVGVKVTATDDDGKSVTKVLTVDVEASSSAPTNLALAATTFAENDIGRLAQISADDADKGDRLAYSIAEDASGLFEVQGSYLVLKKGARLDFDTEPKHDITLRATDEAGLFVTKTFTINLTDVNEAPTAIALSKRTVAESAKAGDVVGYLSGVDPENDQLTFSASGATFEAKSVTVGGETKVALVVAEGAKLDFDEKPKIEVQVTAKDEDGLSFRQKLVIDVKNGNTAPTKLTLDGKSSDTIAENASGGSVVGKLVTTDPDVGDKFTYQIVKGQGDDLFAIKNGQLVVKAGAKLDYETDKSHEVAVKVTDSGGETLTKTFTIKLADVNEAPTAVTFSSTAAKEFINGRSSSGYEVFGVLDGNDPDAKDRHAFELVNDASGKFHIFNDKIYLNFGQTLDYEAKTFYDFTIRATDSGGKSVTSVVRLNVENVNEIPVDVQLRGGSSVDEDADGGATVGSLFARDPDGDEVSFTTDDKYFAIRDGELVVKDGVSFADFGVRLGREAYAQVDVVASDGHGGTTTGIVSVLVKATADFNGGSGNDVKTASASAGGVDYLGNDGNDTLTGSGGLDQIFGGNGDDVLIGNALNDLLDGGTGRDSIDAGGGNDTLVSADGGPDTLDGGPGNFDLAIVDWGVSNVGITFDATAAAASDTKYIKASDGLTFRAIDLYDIRGSQKADVITGADFAEGGDRIDGLTGKDKISGMAGSDRLRAQAGSTISGGAGDDTVDVWGVSKTEDLSALDGGTGVDLLSVTIEGGSDVSLAVTKGFEIIRATVGRGAAVVGSDGADSMTTNGRADFSGGGGGDMFYTTGYATVDGGAGVDRVRIDLQSFRDDSVTVDLSGAVGTTSLGGEFRNLEGAEIWLSNSVSSGVIKGSNSADNIFALGQSSSAQTILGNGGADVINTSGNADGGAGADTITGYLGNQTLSGGADDDRLVSGGADTKLDGGSGNDLLVANGYRNVFTGGSGADIFEFGLRSNVGSGVMDFEAGVDKIRILELKEALNIIDFVVGPDPQPTERGGTWLLYNEATGAVSLDFDGIGKRAPLDVGFLKVTSGTLTIDDFI